MKRKHLFTLVGCLFISMLLLTVLYAFSPLSSKIKRASFKRTFNSAVTKIKRKAVLDLEYNSFYIAGATTDKIYLGNSTASFHLLTTNLQLNDSQHVKLNIINLDSIVEPRRFRLLVDSPYFYLLHGASSQIFKGSIGRWEAASYLPGQDYFFVEAVPFSSSSFALRSYSTRDKGFELAKKTMNSFEIKNSLLEKQLDGMFCVDGQLQYDKKSNWLVYMYHNRNQFIVADSNLNLLHRYNTIDTFSRAKIKVAHLENGKQNMLASPSMRTNERSCISGNYIFVQSNLLSQDEDIERFLHGSVIDIYNLSSGSYIHSFYIPNYKNYKPSSFRILDNHIFAIYDRYLIVYDFTLNT